MHHTRLKKVITTKGQTMWYLGDGLWFGRTSKADAELGLATGKYTMWETVDHRPQLEAEVISEPKTAEVEAIAEVKTDAEVIEAALEATGLKEQFGVDGVDEHGYCVNVAVAKEWIAANDGEEKTRREYFAASSQVEEVRKQMRPIRDRMIGLSMTLTERDAHPEMMPLKAQEAELLVIRDEKKALYNKALDTAWELSKNLFTPPQKQPKQRIEKDYQKLAEYWEKKLNGVAYRLSRAEGALETAERSYESISHRGRELVSHFHLGMVGGSGRNVKKLNKSRVSDVDRLIDASKRVKEAKARVASLRSTLKRYQANYEKVFQKCQKTV